MRHAALLLVVFAASVARCDEPHTLARVLELKPRKGLILLDQGYRGRWTQRFSDDSSGLPLDDDVMEYTHARVSAPRDENGLTLRELVVATSTGSEGAASSYRAPTLRMKEIPPFARLKALKTIAEFEAVFGEFRGFTTGWGMTGPDGKSEQHSSVGWMGFVPIESRSIRVVSVFLHIGNYGDGWVIDKRHIREGVFRPTGKPPQPEKREED